MLESNLPQSPKINATQLAWLQEIGIDRRLLARFRPPVKAVGAGRPLPAAMVAPVGSAGGASRAQVQEHSASSAPALAAASAVVPEPGSVDAGRPARAPSGKTAQPGLISAAKLLKGVPDRAPVPQNWAELEEHVAACQGCSLFSGRSQTVFGAGPTASIDWMVIGEAPGEQDDRLGIPFQGKAGELLQAMLGCIGLGPESPVFFTNLIKCRPRGNRTPSPEEIAACLPYLQRQIALLQPGRILALGRVAAQALLGGESDFEQLRGSAHVFHSETGSAIPVVVTYHPASLLSRSQHKANAWRDLNLAVSVLPGRGHAGQSGPPVSDQPVDSGDSSA